MSGCPYPLCDNDEFEMEYSIGKCPRCQEYVGTCPNCLGYNRGYAKHCRLCGKPIDEKKVEDKFYTRKIQKTPFFTLNKFAIQPLDFLEPEGSMGMPFLRFSKNRAIITTPGGSIYDWDFMQKKEIHRIKIPDLKILVPPVICHHIFALASKNKIFQYDLLEGVKKDCDLPNDSLSVISMVEWHENLYALFIDTSRNNHVFGKINTEKNELEDAVELDDRQFSSNLLTAPDGIFLFSRKKVYAYRKNDGNVALERIKDFSKEKESLNIYGKLYLNTDLKLLLVPEEHSIIRINPATGYDSRLLKHLEEGYFVEYTNNRIIAADDRGLQVFDYSGRKLAESQSTLGMKNVNFNQRHDSMKIVSGRLLFSIAFQSHGGYIIPWILDEPRVLSSLVDLTSGGARDNIVSNIDVSREFAGLVTADKNEKIKEVVIWRF